ncbi:hypothetical protein DDD_1379 [Nonlabens dokdonensis DSW-6]|uniref:Uncharacterized protein n=1 Tax=Nonlabens dokdonensis (strain DSM 17205 / KCTC 12402 / DSW-6) TaxID=592029 RepID=L7W9I8_NONDD|nr:hypothetical protein DDD_1379 [Nonlabens dokdonensis DSW-6]
MKNNLITLNNFKIFWKESLCLVFPLSRKRKRISLITN